MSDKKDAEEPVVRLVFDSNLAAKVDINAAAMATEEVRLKIVDALKVLAEVVAGSNAAVHMRHQENGKLSARIYRQRRSETETEEEKKQRHFEEECRCACGGQKLDPLDPRCEGCQNEHDDIEQSELGSEEPT